MVVAQGIGAGAHVLGTFPLLEDVSAVTELLDDFDAAYTFVANEGSRFWFLTDLQSPRGKVIEIDTSNPARSNWKVVVPESKETLQTVTFVNNKFILNYLKDAYSQFRIYDLSGKFVRNVELPGIGTAGATAGSPAGGRTTGRQRQTS